MAWFKTREEIVEMVELDASLLNEESKIDAGGKTIKKVALVTPLNGPQAIMDLTFFHKKYVETRAPRTVPTAETAETDKPKCERKKPLIKGAHITSTPADPFDPSLETPEPNGQAAVE